MKFLLMLGCGFLVVIMNEIVIKLIYSSVKKEH